MDKLLLVRLAQALERLAARRHGSGGPPPGRPAAGNHREPWGDPGGIRVREAIRRTQIAEERTLRGSALNDLAVKRTQLAEERTLLAHCRTDLAAMRTGLALVVLGVALLRYFGVTTWIVLDGGLILAGLGAGVWSLRNYERHRAALSRLNPKS